MEKLLSIPNGFKIFGLEIRFYGLIMALSYVLGLIICIILCKKKKYNENLPYKLLLIAFPLAVIGGRLGYVLFYGGNWSFAQILDLRSGGLMLYGGVFLALIGIWIYSAVKKENVLKYLDLIAPCLVVAQALGRWGNFFNQEAYGIAIENSAFHWFPFGVFIEADGLWHYATFFYESLWCLITFITIYIIYKKTNKLGLSTSLYLVMYGTERLLVEGLRTDSLYLGSIRVSQLISVIMIVLGSAWLIYLLVKHLKYKQNALMVTNSNVVDENSNSEQVLTQNIQDITETADENTVDVQPENQSENNLVDNTDKNQNAKSKAPNNNKNKHNKKTVKIKKYSNKK